MSVDGDEDHLLTPESVEESTPTEKKVNFFMKPRAVPKSVLSTIFTIGVFTAGICLLKIISKKETWEIVTSPIFLIFTALLVFTWIYGLITGKSLIGRVNKVLWAMIIIMSVMIVVPWGWKTSGAQEAWNKPRYETAFASPVASADYNDADGLEKGLHKFNLPDSGSATGWMKVKKDVRNWSLDYSNCSHYRFLVVFNDGSMIKTWEGGQKEIWGKNFKIVAMAPMSPSDSLGLVLN
jgi:hypothetical protein